MKEKIDSYSDIKPLKLNIYGAQIKNKKTNIKITNSIRTIISKVKNYSFKFIIILSLFILILFATIKYIIKYLKINKELFKAHNIYEEQNKFFFFEKNQEDLNNCTNFGLMIYKYDNKSNVKTPNVVDYIQSLAALQYLPKNCKPYLIDRDQVQYYKGPKVKLIMNGWHFIGDGNLYINNQISPIFLSYHICNFQKLPDIYIKY